MATVNWFPRAASRAQVDTITLGGTWVVGDVANVTINGKTVTFTATGTTAANVVTGLLAALQAATITEFRGITWASPTSTTITGTGTAGEPFAATVSRTTAGTGTISTSTTTIATSAEHWNDSNNWDTGAVPVDGDDVYVDLSLGSIRYGLNQSSVEPCSLTIYSRTQTSNVIGLPRVNASGYVEYRTRELTIKPAACTIDCESPQMFLSFSSGQVACSVIATGQSNSQGVPALTVRGSHVSNTWEIIAGSVGMAIYGGETANGSALQVAEGADVVCGSGCSINALTNRGSLDYSGSFNTLVSNAGVAIIRGTDASTSITAEGGDIDYRSSGTVTNAYAGGTAGGTIDCSKDLTSRTFTYLIIKPGGQLNDPSQTVTVANNITIGTGVRSVSAA